ncbi:transporter [Sulfurifustis variabilis]|uniref:Transporter n=1 Tax=Sulfurifustis variabilis TaxID=1675686 RepID=A0A1B4V650_9GAMM|nr:sodium-dependent transporter [Sulfurifustis variabilis]BAU48998.1 transporter [Sulfurifustis variabilis]
MTEPRPSTPDKPASPAPVAGLSRPVAERWSDSFVFVLAATGATIGFSNFWQFPYLVSQNGGGAFILVYLILAFAVGVPLLISEVLLGRMGRGSPVAVFRDLGRSTRAGVRWVVVGGIGVLGGFLIFTYLSVIAGWALGYFVRSVLGVFDGLTADGVASVFANMVNDPEKQLFWHSAFVVATMLVAARGVRRGLEPAVKLLVPLLFVLLLVLLTYSAALGGFDDAAAFLFVPDFTRLSPMVWLAALAHLFFSLSLGMGLMLVYGAYLKSEASVPRVALTVVGLDTFASVAGAVIVFAVLFAGGVEPAAGPGLVFQAIPLAFDHLPLGRWFASIFFGLLVVVALLTAMGLVEPALVWLHERFGLERRRAVVLCGIIAWALGLVVILSFNHWQFSFRFLGVEKRLGAFDLLQIVTAYGMLPLTGLLVAVFAGWMLGAERVRTELGMRSPCVFDMWLWLVRLVIPALLLVLFFILPKLYA